MTSRTIVHPDGNLKARISLTRHGFVRVTLSEKTAGTFVCEADRSATPNWRTVWRLYYAAPFHRVCDCAHDHVMASRRNELIIIL